MYLIPAKVGAKYATGPNTAPQNAELPANVNGLDMTSNTLHSDEVWGIWIGWIAYWHSLGQPAMGTTCLLLSCCPITRLEVACYLNRLVEIRRTSASLTVITVPYRNTLYKNVKESRWWHGVCDLIWSGSQIILWAKCFIFEFAALHIIKNVNTSKFFIPFGERQFWGWTPLQGGRWIMDIQ